MCLINIVACTRGIILFLYFLQWQINSKNSENASRNVNESPILKFELPITNMWGMVSPSFLNQKLLGLTEIISGERDEMTNDVFVHPYGIGFTEKNYFIARATNVPLKRADRCRCESRCDTARASDTTRNHLCC